MTGPKLIFCPQLFISYQSTILVLQKVFFKTDFCKYKHFAHPESKILEL